MMLRFGLIVLAVECVCVLGIMRERRQVEKSQLRHRRSVCNVRQLFQTSYEGDTLNINLAQPFLDYYANMGGITGIPDMCADDGSGTAERENLIYVVNSEDSKRRRRETPSEGSENYLHGKMGNHRVRRVANEDSVNQDNSAKDNIRTIERLAVKSDEIEAKITAAASVLDSPDIAENKDKFLVYRQRMKSLLRSRLQTLIQEHLVTMEEYRKYEIPQQFHR